MLHRLSPILSVLSPRAKKRLAIAVAGAAAVSLAETGGMLLIVPLMLLLSGADETAGVLGQLNELVGSPGRSAFGILLATLVVSSFLVKALATLSFRWWMIGAMAREEVATSTEILRHYIQMPYVNHLQRGPADLLRSTGDAVTVFYGGVVAGLIGLITESIGITAILAALLVTAPLPTVALFAYFGVAGYVYRRVTRARVARIGSEMTDLSVRTFEAAYTILSGIKAIKMRGNPDHYLAEYESARARAAQVQRTSTILGELPKHLLEMLFIVGIGLASVVIFSQQSSGQSLGLLALFVAAGFRILPGMARLMGALNAVTVGLPMSRIVVAEVAQARQDAQSIDPPALSSEVDPLPFNRQLALSGLTFRYPETPVDVLRGIDLTIDRGTSVALVGGSGAGKTAPWWT